MAWNWREEWLENTQKSGVYKKRLFIKNSPLYHLQKSSEWSHFLLCLTCKQCHVGHFPFLWQSGKLSNISSTELPPASKKAWGKDTAAAANLIARGTRAKSRSVRRRKGPGCVQPPSSQGGSQVELKWCELPLLLSVYSSLCLLTIFYKLTTMLCEVHYHSLSFCPVVP